MMWLMVFSGTWAQPLLPDDFDEGRRAYDAGFFDEALLLWKPMAEAGDLRAQFAMGTLYFEGAGVAQDFELSTYWYRLSADQGLPAAQYNVGNSYRYGYGVDQNNVTAIHWWRLASEQGLASASFNIGTQYLYGRGVARDEEEAFAWYRKAAAQGHPRAAKMFTDNGEIIRTEVTLPGAEPTPETAQPEPALVEAPEVLSEPATESSETELVSIAEPPESSVAPEPVDRPELDIEPVASVPVDNTPQPVVEAPIPAQSAKAETSQQSVLYGSDWLMGHNPDHYTVQLAAMTEEARVSRYISRHQIKGELAYFQFERDGRVFYALVMGVYPDRSAANAAIAELPERVRAGTPWPRQIAGIQVLIEP